jgi:hypothetical protein
MAWRAHAGALCRERVLCEATISPSALHGPHTHLVAIERAPICDSQDAESQRACISYLILLLPSSTSIRLNLAWQKPNIKCRVSLVEGSSDQMA